MLLLAHHTVSGKLGVCIHYQVGMPLASTCRVIALSGGVTRSDDVSASCMHVLIEVDVGVGTYVQDALTSSPSQNNHSTKTVKHVFH